MDQVRNLPSHQVFSNQWLEEINVLVSLVTSGWKFHFPIDQYITMDASATFASTESFFHKAIQSVHFLFLLGNLKILGMIRTPKLVSFSLAS